MSTQNSQQKNQNITESQANSMANKIKKARKVSIILLISVLVFNFLALGVMGYVDSFYDIDFFLRRPETVFVKTMIIIAGALKISVSKVNIVVLIYLIILLVLLFILSSILFIIKKRQLFKKWLIVHFIFFIIILIMWTIVSYVSKVAKKPVIYLYPATKQEVQVKIDFSGKLLTSIPSYNKGWEVTAFPDGRIINHQDNLEYPYLFWEGRLNKMAALDFAQGFIIEGLKTEQFLREKLSEIGLLPHEYNEFIHYWVPLMKTNQYNFIYFVGEEYTKLVKLNILPSPEAILRVFMVYKPLKNIQNIPQPVPQIFSDFDRKGFTVVEWGGMRLK